MLIAAARSFAVKPDPEFAAIVTESVPVPPSIRAPRERDDPSIVKASLLAPPDSVSAPPPPTSVSLPRPPVIESAPVAPVMLLSRLLPEAVIDPPPV